MTSVLKLFFFTFLICVMTLAVVAILFGIDKHPIVNHNTELSYDHLKKVKQIIRNNKSRRFSKGGVEKLSLTENELNLLIAYAISHGIDTNHLFIKAELSDNNLKSVLTIQLPSVFSGYYINCRTTFKQNEDFLTLDALRIGRIKFPIRITKSITYGLHNLLLNIELYESLWQNAQAIKRIIVNKETITVHYAIRHGMLKDLKEKSQSFLIPDKHQQKLVEYHNHLSILSRIHQSKENALLDLIKDLFAYAEKNSGRSGNPILENTTAVQVLSLYIIGQRLDGLLKPEYRKALDVPVRTKLLFHHRYDLPKHFLVSAALTVSTGSKFSSLVGLAKEIEDSDGGSGFSFADLAADKAGVTFGKMAVASADQALQFQEKISRIQYEHEIMPSISSLPEGLMELEFKRRYTDLNSKPYRLISMEIDRRLSQCRLYRE